MFCNGTALRLKETGARGRRCSNNVVNVAKASVFKSKPSKSFPKLHYELLSCEPNQTAGNKLKIKKSENSDSKSFLEESNHSEAILTTPLGSYFGPTRPGPCLNNWKEGTSTFTLNGHCDIKTACIETPAKSGKDVQWPCTKIFLKTLSQVIFLLCMCTVSQCQFFFSRVLWCDAVSSPH